MKQIAFLSVMEGATWGGSEELWSQTAQRLAQRHRKVIVCVKSWPVVPEPVVALQQAGCCVEFRRPLRRLQRMLGQTETLWLDRWQPDFVVISQGMHYDGVEWAHICRRRNIPYALIAQSAGEHWWPDDPLAELIAQAYERAAAAYFVSEENLRLARRQFGIPLAHAKIVRNPFNVSYEAEPPWPEETDGFRLACVGRLEPKSKGQDILFRALAQAKWRERPLAVTLYGSGVNEQGLKRMAREYELSQVSFGGFTSDVAAIWRAHHALVLPSRYEGLPLAVVEAMLCARPCIVTDVAGNTELLQEGFTGFIAAAPVTACLDAALERAWQRREEWQAMGQEAARAVRRSVPRDPIGAFADELEQVAF